LKTRRFEMTGVLIAFLSIPFVWVLYMVWGWMKG
jgi:hypothetical protein